MKATRYRQAHQAAVTERKTQTNKDVGARTVAATASQGTGQRGPRQSSSRRTSRDGRHVHGFSRAIPAGPVHTTWSIAPRLLLLGLLLVAAIFVIVVVFVSEQARWCLRLISVGLR